MNWTIIEVNGVWQVVDLAGNVVSDGHATKEDAIGALREMVNAALLAFAEEDGNEDTTAGARFEMEFVEDERSVDNRVIDVDATQFDRPPPLPQMIMRSLPEMGGHAGAEVSGVIDEVERSGKKLFLRGHFDSGSEAGREAERLVGEGIMTWWSPDFSSDSSVDLECVAEDEDGFCEEFLLHLTRGTLIGGTICPKQALTSARIRIIDAETASAAPTTAAQPETPSVVPNVALLTAAAAPGTPPSEWFEDPVFGTNGEDDHRLSRLPSGNWACPLTIEESGRVYGHVAPWHDCHIGRPDVCTTCPPSATGYAHFMLGEVRPAGCDCDAVPVGQITIGTGHAPLEMSANEARAHYDDTGTAIVDVFVGEDAHGPWYAGALREGVTEEQVRIARAAGQVSGDWRRIGGNLELVGLLIVNVAGFPIPRVRARVASGHQTALVAAGAIAMGKVVDERMESLSAADRIALREARGVARDRILDRIVG